MSDYIPIYERRYKAIHYSNNSQEDWIKNNVRKAAQTQCTQCGKWISKYWKEGTSINHVMTKCGPCDNGK